MPQTKVNVARPRGVPKAPLSVCRTSLQLERTRGIPAKKQEKLQEHNKNTRHEMKACKSILYTLLVDVILLKPAANQLVTFTHLFALNVKGWKAEKQSKQRLRELVCSLAPVLTKPPIVIKHQHKDFLGIHCINCGYTLSQQTQS